MLLPTALDPVVGINLGERASILARFVLVYLAWLKLSVLPARKFAMRWIVIGVLLAGSFLAQGLLWIFAVIALAYFISAKAIPKWAWLVALCLLVIPIYSHLRPPDAPIVSTVHKSDLRRMTLEWIDAENYFYARHYAKLWVASATNDRPQAEEVLKRIEIALRETREKPQP